MQIQNTQTGYRILRLGTEYSGWVQNTKAGYRILRLDADTEYSYWVQNTQTGYRILRLGTEYSDWVQNTQAGYRILRLGTEYSGWVQNTQTGYRIHRLDTEYSGWVQNTQTGYRIPTLGTEYARWVQNTHAGCMKRAGSDKGRQAKIGRRARERVVGRHWVVRRTEHPSYRVVLPSSFFSLSTISRCSAVSSTGDVLKIVFNYGGWYHSVEVGFSRGK